MLHRRNLDDKLRVCWQRLGIPETLLSERRLPLFDEAVELQLAETASDGREHYLSPAAAAAWSAMRSLALRDDVSMHIVSAHRSIERQVEIIAGKLAAGQSIEQILAVSAPPGCSEHHTGRAIDIGTFHCRPLEPEFEHTATFEWLRANARRFGFHLSFPRGNRWGYDYEPWHWCFDDSAEPRPPPAA